MSIKKRGRAVGSIKNGASLRLIHNLSQSLTCFYRAESYIVCVILAMYASYILRYMRKYRVAVWKFRSV